jgi:hypothetical protein
LTCTFAGSGRKNRAASAEGKICPPPPRSNREAGLNSTANAGAETTREGSPYSPSSAVESMKTDNTETPSTPREEGVLATPSADPRGADGQNEGGSEVPPPLPLDPREQAKEFVKKVKAKHVADIKAKLDKDMLAYNTI